MRYAKDAAGAPLSMRRQKGPGSGYRLTLRPATHEVEIAGAAFHYPRTADLDASQPITIRAFVQGSIIECFVNDAYAFTCHAYDFRTGTLALDVSGGKAQVMELSVQTSP